MNTAEAIKAKVQSALDSIHAVEADLGWTGDSENAIRQLEEALSALSAASVEQQPLTDSYTQQVPDKCDRIVWRNAYYHLPIAPQSIQPVSALTDERIEKLQSELAWHKESLSRVTGKLRSVWIGLETAIERHTGKPCSGEPFDDLAALLSATSQPSEAEIRRKALEEAAKVCDAKFNVRAEGGFPREASTARALAEEIRALASADGDAQAPAVREDVKYGWLVENGKQGVELRYRTWRDGIPAWTADHEEATRYCRRIDAERAHQEDEDAWRIVEHGWHTTAASHPAPAQTGEKK